MNRKYGCLMGLIPDPWKSQIKNFANSIPKHHIQTEDDGEPHVTIKYGFINTPAIVFSELLGYFTKFSPIKIKTKTLSLFKGNEDGDVLILEVESKELRFLNELVGSLFPCVDKYPVYKPHITIAYLNPNYSASYTSSLCTFLNQDIEINEVEYSDADRVSTIVKLDEGKGSKTLSYLNGNLGGALVPPPEMAKKRKTDSPFRNRFVVFERDKLTKNLTFYMVKAADPPVSPAIPTQNSPAKTPGNKQIGQKWQGPSGKWFTLIEYPPGTGKHKVVPTSDPGNQIKTVKEGKEVVEKVSPDKANPELLAKSIQDVIDAEKVPLQEIKDRVFNGLYEMPLKDITEIKKQFGVKASGRKVEFAKKVADRIIDKLVAEGKINEKDVKPAEDIQETKKEEVKIDPEIAKVLPEPIVEPELKKQLEEKEEEFDDFEDEDEEEYSKQDIKEMLDSTGASTMEEAIEIINKRIADVRREREGSRLQNTEEEKSDVEIFKDTLNQPPEKIDEINKDTTARAIALLQKEMGRDGLIPMYALVDYWADSMEGGKDVKDSIRMQIESALEELTKDDLIDPVRSRDGRITSVMFSDESGLSTKNVKPLERKPKQQRQEEPVQEKPTTKEPWEMTKEEFESSPQPLDGETTKEYWKRVGGEAAEFLMSNEGKPDHVYRGMSKSEIDNILKSGIIKSDSRYNVGSGEEGHTLFSKNPSQATNYASTFAHKDSKVDTANPGYVVEVKQPSNVKPGLSRDHLMTDQPVSADTVSRVYEVRPKAMRELPNGEKVRYGGYTYRDVTDQFKSGKLEELSDDPHRSAVEAALAAGKTVPPEVLAEYPDLLENKKEKLVQEKPVQEKPVQAVEEQKPQRTMGDVDREINEVVKQMIEAEDDDDTLNELTRKYEKLKNEQTALKQGQQKPPEQATTGQQPQEQPQESTPSSSSAGEPGGEIGNEPKKEEEGVPEKPKLSPEEFQKKTQELTEKHNRARLPSRKEKILDEIQRLTEEQSGTPVDRNEIIKKTKVPTVKKNVRSSTYTPDVAKQDFKEIMDDTAKGSVTNEVIDEYVSSLSKMNSYEIQKLRNSLNIPGKETKAKNIEKIRQKLENHLEMYVKSKAISPDAEEPTAQEPEKKQELKTKEEVRKASVEEIQELLQEKYPNTGMLPIHELRSLLKEKYGEQAGSEAIFNEAIKQLRNEGIIKLRPISDPGKANQEQINNSIPGIGETLFYIETDKNFKSKEKQKDPKIEKTTKEAAVKEFTELLKNESTGMVPIHKLRSLIKEKYGEQAGSHSMFDDVLKKLRNDGVLQIRPISDLSRASPEQLNASIAGIHETLYYLEKGDKFDSYEQETVQEPEIPQEQKQKKDPQKTLDKWSADPNLSHPSSAEIEEWGYEVGQGHPQIKFEDGDIVEKVNLDDLANTPEEHKGKGKFALVTLGTDPEGGLTFEGTSSGSGASKESTTQEPVQEPETPQEQKQNKDSYQTVEKWSEDPNLTYPSVREIREFGYEVGQGHEQVEFENGDIIEKVNLDDLPNTPEEYKGRTALVALAKDPKGKLLLSGTTTGYRNKTKWESETTQKKESKVSSDDTSEPNLWEATKEAWGDIEQRFRKTGEIPKIWNLVEYIQNRIPNATKEQIHSLLQKWQKEDLLTLQVVNDPHLETRSAEGIQSDRGVLGYLDIHDSALDKQIEAPQQTKPKDTPKQSLKKKENLPVVKKNVRSDVSTADKVKEFYDNLTEGINDKYSIDDSVTDFMDEVSKMDVLRLKELRKKLGIKGQYKNKAKTLSEIEELANNKKNEFEKNQTK